ncbi:MAG: glycosyltransferase family 2 protein [Minisyncoccia bacterium]|jgi:glycosyltransferase involved in cell wall biosynthesis
MKSPVSVIILTLNEEINIEKCLKSVAGWAGEIIIVDCHSTDRTLEIAKRYGAKIFEHDFKNQAVQFNWALDNVPIKNDWILRLDSDEYVLPELAEEIQERTGNASAETSGFYIKRRVYFMGRWIKHGGYYPTWFLRLWRKGNARYEDREVDEHVVLSSGRADFLKNDFVDENRKNLEWWIGRTNNYTTREVVARGKEAEESLLLPGRFFGTQSERKRWLRTNVYYRLPLFTRAFIYFFYRYFFRLGFLDGKEGLVFHFLQGCWNQFLVDAKIYEQTKNN